MPDWSKLIRGRLEGLNLPPTREAEVIEELNQHLNDRYEELMASGAVTEEATRTIVSELDSGGLVAELQPLLRPAPDLPAMGERHAGGRIAQLWRDIRYGARLLRRNPGFATVAILSLALGIGANTAIFQLLDAILLRSLPVDHPEELADVVLTKTEGGRTGWFSGGHPQLTSAMWQEISQEQQGFAHLAAWNMQSLNLTQGGEARYANALWVSGNFFDTLGVRAAHGRSLSPADDQAGCGGAVVISNAFWQREFGGRGDVLGSTLRLEGHPFEIIGITPASFYGVEVGRNFDVALPTCAEPVANSPSRMKNPAGWWLAAIGRLKPGWTAERASAQLASASSGILAATIPSGYDALDRERYLKFQLGVRPAASGVSSLRTEYETPLWLLLAVAGLVLLIACANLANLMMARANSRLREMAVRLALGASPFRLASQMLAESLLLAGIGAAVGAGLAQLLSRLLVSFLSTENSQVFVSLTPDWRVLTFTSGLTLLTAILFGLLPAVQSARTPPGEAMTASGRGTTAGRDRHSMRRALVVSQVALSLVLLVGALLFVRTLQNLEKVETGFHRTNVLVSTMDFTALNIPLPQRTTYRQQILERLRSIPGVDSAAGSNIIPVSGEGWNDNINISEFGIRRAVANFDQVTPGYFRTMRTPLIAGRDFTENDTLASPLVAVVTETFVRKFLHGTNPVGKTFSVVLGDGKPERAYQIVGLVKDVKYSSLREEFTPIVFVSELQDQQPDPYSQVLLRADVPLADVTAAVKKEMAALNPGIVLKFSVFDRIVREGLLRERLMATLSGFFGLLAAILAMVGLYGVVSYMVARRKNEIGIRIALGANALSILGMILREAARLVGIGLATGTVLALFAGTAASAMLFQMKPSDPLTLVTAGASLAAVAVAASLLPAHRAARLDPMQALREE